MLCVDGIEVEWDYSSLPTISVTSEQLLALGNKQCAASRMLAHAELTEGQLRAAYRDRGFAYGLLLRKSGRKLKKLKLESYAKGIRSDTLLVRALKGDDKSVIMAAILAIDGK